LGIKIGGVGEMKKGNDPLMEIYNKLDKMHEELAAILGLLVFPEGREKAVEQLEQKIHNLTFQGEINGNKKTD